MRAPRKGRLEVCLKPLEPNGAFCEESPLCVRRAGAELVAAATTTFDSSLTTAPVLAAAPRTPAVAPATDTSALTLLASAAPLAQRALVVGCSLLSIGCLPVAAPVAAVLFVLIGFLVDTAIRATPVMPDADTLSAAETSTIRNELAMVVYDEAQAARRTANVPVVCSTRASGATMSSSAPTTDPVSTAALVATAAVPDLNTVPAADKVTNPVLLTVAVSATAARAVPAVTANASAAAVTSASRTDLAMVVYDARRAARTVLAAVEKSLLFTSGHQKFGLAPETIVHHLFIGYGRSLKLHTKNAAFAATTAQLPVIVAHPAVREANADGDADNTVASDTTATTTFAAPSPSDSGAGLAVVVYDTQQAAHSMHTATTTRAPAAPTDNALPASHTSDSLDRVADNAAPTRALSLDNDRQFSVQVLHVPARHARTRLQNRLQIQQLTPITAYRDVESSEPSALAATRSPARQLKIKTGGVLHPRADESPATSPSPKAPGSSSSSIAAAAATTVTAVAATASPDVSATSRRTKRWDVASRLFKYLKEPWYLTHRAKCKERRAKHESANSSRRTSTSSTGRR